MSVQTPYKPSPLGYGSSPTTRKSPFRRPGSPAPPSPLRFSTPSPSSSPTKAEPVNRGSSKLARPTTPTSTQDSLTPKAKSPEIKSPGEMASSPLRPHTARSATSRSLGNGNALSQLQASQVRTMRDAFGILDRDCDGFVNREDVADMLNQLGLPSSASDVTKFFPPSAPQTTTLAVFLNSLAEGLATLSQSDELLSAFSAFDDDDSGQIDLAMLKEALIHTAPEPGEKQLSAMDVDKVVNGFTGRRAFNRQMNNQFGAKRGDVFRYQEFVNSIMGTNNGADGTSKGNSED